MGPPIYIGGNRYDAGHRRETRLRLQWGHRFTSVETYLQSIWRCRRYRLQWGHRFTSVETDRYPPLGIVQQFASMGPPIYIGGNGGVEVLITWLERLLQWGHRFTSVETIATIGIQIRNDLASMGPPIYIGGNFC
mgnify:CR=1 FL=1